jgi:hypothetical protein
MAFDQQRNIKRLKTEIELKRAALAEERSALQKLQNEIASFARQYDRTIGPLEAELDAVRQEIESLQTRPVMNHDSIWGPGFSSFEESFDAKYRTSNPPISFDRPKRAVDDNALRALYRKLARKYHPDTSTDPDEKTRLTIIMAQINAAYRARNIDELQAIDGQKFKSPKIAPPVVDATGPREPTYFDLVKVAEGLDAEIAWTRSEHSRVLSSPLMSLKIEASIARSQGRDLLREIAAKIRGDLDAARVELAELRRVR